MEDIEKNIDLIEKEKQEYLENHPEEDTEETEDVDVEETEFSLTEDEIDEWIVKLTELKVNKIPIELEVDDETTLKINFDEEEE